MILVFLHEEVGPVTDVEIAEDEAHFGQGEQKVVQLGPASEQVVLLEEGLVLFVLVVLIKMVDFCVHFKRTRTRLASKNVKSSENEQKSAEI